MSDLISRSAVLNFIKEEVKQDRPDDFKIRNIQRFIEGLPTAYDTDKVVAELEEERLNYFLTIANTGSEKLDIAYGYASDAVNRAIDIVKRGGVE
jgi:hypothetical protein